MIVINDHPSFLSYVVTIFVLRLALVILVLSDNYLLLDTVFSKTKDFDTNQIRITASISALCTFYLL